MVKAESDGGLSPRATAILGILGVAIAGGGYSIKDVVPYLASSVVIALGTVPISLLAGWILRGRYDRSRANHHNVPPALSPPAAHAPLDDMAETILKIIARGKRIEEDVVTAEAGVEAVAAKLRVERLRLRGFVQANGEGLRGRWLVATSVGLEYLQSRGMIG